MKLPGGRLGAGLLITALAIAVRVAWAAAIPTIPVGDFAMYRESATHLLEHGRFDPGFIYMPGFVLLLAAVGSLGGDVLAAKLIGAVMGGLAAGAVYFIAACLVERAADAGEREGEADGSASAPAAVAAGLMYALWPAGIALASVVGTDVPAGAVMLFALMLLAVLGPRRPRAAALAFGAAMGLAAYFRAVALPLASLSALYWLAARARLRAVVVRTAIAVAATFVVLAPWAVRNQLASGELYFTDSHGGVTALMGNYPNTEGTYTRSLNEMFEELTGKTFLSPPHRETDRAAYAIAKRWIGFDPLWTAGMIALRTERLFARERGLLYWPIYREGVLPAREAAFFNRHQTSIPGPVDLFYVAFIVASVAGVAFALAERRWTALVPVPFALALAATYALFVAEPRYRVTTELFFFPVAGYGLARLVRAAARVIARVRARGADANADAGIGLPRADRWALGTTAVGLAALVVVALVVMDGGAALRARRRWAVTVWSVDGHARMAFWRRADAGGTSPVTGAPTKAMLGLPDGRRAADVEVTLADVDLPAGPVHVTADVAWLSGAAPGTSIAFGPATIAGGRASASVDFTVAHAGGPFRLPVHVTAADAPPPDLAISIEHVTLASASAPSPTGDHASPASSPNAASIASPSDRRSARASSP